MPHRERSSPRGQLDSAGFDVIRGRLRRCEPTRDIHIVVVSSEKTIWSEMETLQGANETMRAPAPEPLPQLHDVLPKEAYLALGCALKRTASLADQKAQYIQVGLTNEFRV